LVCERVFAADCQETILCDSAELVKTGNLTRRALAGCGQALDHKCRQVVLKDDILEVTEELRNGRVCATRRSQLSGVLGYERVIQRVHGRFGLREEQLWQAGSDATTVMSVDGWPKTFYMA